MARISAIMDRSFVPNTRTDLTVKGEFLPLTQTATAWRLFESYAQAAADIGFHTDGEFTLGCAVSGFTAALGAATICAVGPVGGKAHRRDEFMRIDSLIPRALRPARGRFYGGNGGTDGGFISNGASPIHNAVPSSRAVPGQRRNRQATWQGKARQRYGEVYVTSRQLLS
jgi:hypothetical protein